MGFYRFEKLKSHHFNPHLSTTQGPVIEGEYMYFRRVTKEAGSRSKPHYHPNEFMAFFLEGRSHAMLGDGRRIARPGMLVHIPSNAQHSFKAIDDVKYLYIKDRTWTLIGAAADEALPDEAVSATQLAKELKAGTYRGGNGAGKKSAAIIEGLGNCFYPWLESLDAPIASGHHAQWLEGKNLCFGLIEAPPGYRVEEKAPHELFAYVLSGGLDSAVGSKRRQAEPGDVIHVPRGERYALSVGKKRHAARYAVVRSTAALEDYVSKNGAADNWRG